MHSHLFHLLVQSMILSVFFAVLLHDEKRRRVRFAAILFASLTGGTILLATLMLPFPG